MKFASIFAGKMLGDGYLNISGKNRSPRFCFLHKKSDSEYARHCLNLFSTHLSYGPNALKEKKYYDIRTRQTYYSVYCQSKTSNLLHQLYSMWYLDRKKVIPQQWVMDNIEADGLAIWFQDDGCLKKNNRIILSTEGFSNCEILFLQNLLLDKFAINAHIDGQRRLDISSRVEARKFQMLVEPFLDSSMNRKGMGMEWKAWKTEWQETQRVRPTPKVRTSIYLPYDLHYFFRGSGYSQKLNVILEDWLNQQWKRMHSFQRVYFWIMSNSSIEKGAFLLTPRFNGNIKGKLDLLAKVTGFERSQLVTLALYETLAHKEIPFYVDK